MEQELEQTNGQVQTKENKITKVKTEQSKKPKAHVSDEKKKLVKDLIELLKKKTIIVVSIKNLPSAQFQEIKKKLRDKAMIMVIKKSLINYALEHAQDAHLKELEKYVQEDSALLFSDDDLFEISAFLSENKSPAKARIGQLAPEDISIDAGPTELIPGPDISALGAVGLKVKVENGKISITEPHILLKKDEEITEAKASILAKLDIEPFKIGLEPVSGFFDGKVYTNVKIDKEATLEELKSFAGKSISFGVSLNYITNDTLSYLLGKAGSHEKALAGLIKEESKEEKPVEEKKDEKPAEEEKGKVEEENKGESQNK